MRRGLGTGVGIVFSSLVLPVKKMYITCPLQLEAQKGKDHRLR